LTGPCLETLRREIAWVDPTVHLWNRSFIDNLQYGSNHESTPSVNQAIKLSDLLDVLEKLPDGLQTTLGEGGALVSGGQGQRVRLGRAMLRDNVKLVILDEPFRGLERERRRRLLERARQHWRKATLICITHDVGETLGFERVVVIHEGRIAEDNIPAVLATQADSRYSSLLAAETDVRKGMWEREDWRRLILRDKQLIESQ
jgi:ABC-type transport system involved in cytochrome bd biosynthesis fused ATPase/permease subunit